jgi:hypothetical protein
LLACGAIGAAVALAVNPVIPSDNRSFGQTLAAICAKAVLAGAAYVAAARLIARPELNEGLRAIRSITGRRRAA